MYVVISSPHHGKNDISHLTVLSDILVLTKSSFLLVWLEQLSPVKLSSFLDCCVAPNAIRMFNKINIEN